MLSGSMTTFPARGEAVADPQVAHRNDVALDWADAWTLEMARRAPKPTSSMSVSTSHNPSRSG